MESVGYRSWQTRSFLRSTSSASTLAGNVSRDYAEHGDVGDGGAVRTCGALWALPRASSGSLNREDVLDHFRCGDDDGFQLPTRYFAGVASISTMYGGRLERQPASRIPQCNFFVDEFLSQCFPHAWQMLDGVESVILRANQHIDAVCTVIFGGGKAGRTSQPTEDLCTEADDAWATSHASYRRNSVLLATSNLFLATAVVSHGAKAPLAHFMVWVQRENQLLGKVRDIAKSKGEVYLGHTSLSHRSQM